MKNAVPFGIPEDSLCLGESQRADGKNCIILHGTLAQWGSML